MSQVVEAPVEIHEPSPEDVPLDERPWVVIVWNDPINLMSYVTLVLQQLFGYSKAKATRLMLQVHNKRKAALSTGTREKAELDVSGSTRTALGDHAAGLGMRRGIDRRRNGTYRVPLPAEERDILAALPGQLRDALDAGEPTLYRRSRQRSPTTMREMRTTRGWSAPRSWNRSVQRSRSSSEPPTRSP